MARTEIKSQANGVVLDSNGNAVIGATVAIKNLDGTAATHWSAKTGGTSSTANVTTGSDGSIPRFIETGSYNLNVTPSGGSMVVAPLEAVNADQVAGQAAGAWLGVADEGSNLTFRGRVNFTGAGVTATDDAANGRTNVTIPGGSSGSGHVIQDEGTSRTQRTNMNFVGAGVTATDSAGTDSTIVTIPGGGHVIQDEGTARTARAALNFTGAAVTVTDDSVNNRTNVAIAASGGGASIMAAQDPEGDWWTFDVDSDGIAVTTNVGPTPPVGGDIVLTTVPMSQSPDGSWWVHETDDTGRVTTTNVGPTPTTGTPPFASTPGNNTFVGENTFTADVAINGGGFTPNYDTALWIAPATRNNPILNHQAMYIQCRVTGNVGGLVHDAAASELRLSTASNFGAGAAAHEMSLVVSGTTANTINTTLNAVLANFHTEGTPSGTIDAVALFRGTQMPALTGTITVGTTYGLKLDSQVIGATNWTIHAPNGNSMLGVLLPPDVNTSTLVARGLSGQVQPVLNVQNNTPTTVMQVLANATGGMGGIISGTTWSVNNNLATGATLATRVRGHSAQTAHLWQIEESGGTAHVYVTAATSSLPASLVVGKAALATTATDGFLYIPTVAGVSTGVPTTRAGTVAMIYDTTNQKIGVYNGAWRWTAALT